MAARGGWTLGIVGIVPALLAHAGCAGRSVSHGDGSGGGDDTGTGGSTAVGSGGSGATGPARGEATPARSLVAFRCSTLPRSRVLRASTSQGLRNRQQPIS